jgi:ribonuclease P protein component
MASVPAWQPRTAVPFWPVVVQKVASVSLPDGRSVSCRSVSSHGFGKSLRLVNSGDFKRVFDDAPLRASHRHFLILARANQLPFPRLGLVISKKSIRLAVDRNRVKRLIRENFRRRQESLAGLDIIVLSRKGMDELSNADISHQLDQQWQRIVRKHQQARQPADQSTPTTGADPCAGSPSN